MTLISTDKFILTQSESKNVNNVNNAISINLKLNEQINTLIATIKGTILDNNNIPIQGALVRLSDKDFNLLTHTFTDINGDYIFKDSIPAVSVGGLNVNGINSLSQSAIFNISAIAVGKLLGVSHSFSLENGQTHIQNFILQDNDKTELNIITGSISNQATSELVFGAVLSLYQVDINNNQQLIQRTFSNEFGDYAFLDVNLGNYILVIESLSYLTKSINIEITEQGEIINLPIQLQQDPNASLGTISGIIRNNLNVPINRADVILYRVNTNKTLTPLGFTKTNEHGVYLFSNVGHGEYKIKSNEFEFIIFN